MTKSNGTHSTSDKPSSREPRTWEVLSSSQQEVARLREFHHSSLWDSLRDLLNAERLFHLERLAETDNEQESRDHRIIARWIKHFLEEVPAEVESGFASMKAEAEGKVERVDTKSGGTAYMESDAVDKVQEEALT